MDEPTPVKKDSDSNRLETLLMVIIIIVVAGLVWFVWHSKQVADKNLTALNTTPKRSATAPVAKTPSTSAQISAVNLVQTTFKTANTFAANNGIDPSQGEVDAIKSSLSPELYDKLSASVKSRSQYDPILCAQEFPDNITATLVGVNGNNATLVVTESFGPSKQNITTMVDLASQQLTGIACPAAPGS